MEVDLTMTLTEDERSDAKRRVRGEGAWQQGPADWREDKDEGRERLLVDCPRPFACAYCEKAFKRKDHLIIHEKVHTGDKPFVCEMCGQRFAQKTHLRNHLTKHSDLRAFACIVCGKRFKRKDSLKLHEKIHHNENNMCSICGLMFETRDMWRLHLASHYPVQL